MVLVILNSACILTSHEEASQIIYTSRKSNPSTPGSADSLKLKTLTLGAWSNLVQIPQDGASETPLGALSFYVRLDASFPLARGY